MPVSLERGLAWFHPLGPPAFFSRLDGSAEATGVEPCLRVRSSCRLSWGPETRGRRRAWSLQPVPHLPQHGRPESPPGQAADTTHEQVRVPGGGQPGATWPPRPQPRGGRCFPWCRAQVPLVAGPCGTPSASRAGHFFRIFPCLFLVPGFY